MRRCCPLIWLHKVPEHKTVKNRVHLDMFGDVDAQAVRSTVVGQGRERTVMADQKLHPVRRAPPVIAVGAGAGQQLHPEATGYRIIRHDAVALVVGRPRYVMPLPASLDDCRLDVVSHEEQRVGGLVELSMPAHPRLVAARSNERTFPASTC